MEDSIFLIEDNFIVARRGVNKDLLARGNRSHMANPGGEAAPNMSKTAQIFLLNRLYPSDGR
jgi:hypothetical protein